MPSRTTIAAGLVAALGITTALAQTPAPDLAKFPDWSGQWRKFPGQGNPRDQTKPLGRAQQAPLTREYQAIYDANLADQAQGGQGIDPTGYCIPFAMPRMMTGVSSRMRVEFLVYILRKLTKMHLLSDHITDRIADEFWRHLLREVAPKF